MFNIVKKEKHQMELPDFSRGSIDIVYPFENLSVGDFFEIFVDSEKDWDQEVMYEHDCVFARNHGSEDSKVFRHQPLRPERLIRIWRIK